jgi:hypothetical protein
MIIRGVLDSSLNGQLCFRGFAPIKQLARISKADYSYQRNPIEDREDIIDFLEKQTYLFFPEIILSYKVKHAFDSGTKTPPIEAIQLGKRYVSGVDQTRISVRGLDYKNTNDVRGTSKLKLLEMELNESTLIDEIENGNQPFHRIDGNHRLKAAEVSETSKVDNMIAPFCILLGEEFYTNGTKQSNPTTAEFEKSTKVFFHNINTKTVPLSSEENLKVIIDDSTNFPKDELVEILGNYAIHTRELIKKIKPENFTGLSHIIEKKYRTYYNMVFHYLLESGEEEKGLTKRVFESLKAIEQLYFKDRILKKSKSIGLLTAFLVYHVRGDLQKFEFFKHWVLKNHIYKIEEISIESLVDIFDKLIDKQNIKLFVAMKYWSHKKVNEYNKLFKEILKELQSTLIVDATLELIPIMRFKGESRRIDRRLLDSIKDCDVFVADITECNENVLFEVAFAEGCEKSMILIKEEKDEATPPFDMDKLQWIPYDGETYYTSIKGIVKNNLKEILKTKYGIE